MKLTEDLTQNIAKLELKHKSTCSPKVYRELLEARKKLEALEVSKIKKNILFLKQKYWLKSPKQLKLLAWKVKERRGTTHVHLITDAKKQKQTLAPKIADVFKEFYAQLYSSAHPEEANIQNFLQKYGFQTKLSPGHKDMLDEPITTEEVLATINHMKNNKAPGPDGFGAEFYKVYAQELAPHLTAACNEVMRGGIVPPSWNEATVVVIPKPGRDQTDPKSYRPISLLNNAYKVLTALLTARLNKIVPEYVHRDQAGFIPGRDILDNVYRTLEVIHHCKSQEADPALLLSLDVEKAFDRVEHEYILSLLYRMNFGPYFTNAIRALYTSPTASVRVNGLQSGTFSVARGTRQGCPLSPLLFALAIEPLAEALRNLKEFKGVQIRKRTQTISLFADDMVLYVGEPETSLPAIIEILEEFRQVSGLNVNADKSLIFPLKLDQELQTRLKTDFPFIWVQDHWRYLGIFIPLDFTQFSRLNLERIDAEVRDTLKMWDKKQLSWFDRLQVVMSLVFPKYLFLFRTAPLGVTEQLLRRWQQGLLDFVWQYKRPRLSKDLLCLSKQRGGLGFPDLAEYYRASLLAAFAKRYSTSFSAPWKDLMQDALLPYGFREVAWNEQLGKRLLHKLSPINKAILKV